MRGTVMRALVGAVMLFPLAAEGATDAPQRAWGAGARVEQAYNSNVDQQEGADRHDDFVTSMAGQVDWTNPRRARLPGALSFTVAGHVYAQFSRFNYIEFRPEAVLPLRWRVDGIVGYLYSPRRLLFDENGGDGPVYYQDHLLTLGLGRKFGAAREWRSELLFKGKWTDYRSINDKRDAFAPGFAWTGRYRWDVSEGWALTPRLDLDYAARDARSENYDRDEVEAGGGLQLEQVGGPTARVRYAHTWRDYTVGSERNANGGNNNYRREDNYDQVQTWLAVPVARIPGLSVGARYRFRTGVFDEPNHKAPDESLGVKQHFDVHEFGLELSYVY